MSDGKRWNLSEVSDEQMQAELSWRGYTRQLTRVVQAGVCMALPLRWNGGEGFVILGGKMETVPPELLGPVATYLQQMRSFHEEWNKPDEPTPLPTNSETTPAETQESAK